MKLPIAVIAAAWALIAYVVYVSISSVLRARRNAARARELKCEEPPFQKNRYPLGIDNLLRALAADRRKQFPTDAVQRIKDVGAITFKYSILGSTGFTTADEKNIQAVLATQFADFGKLSSFLKVPVQLSDDEV